MGLKQNAYQLGIRPLRGYNNKTGTLNTGYKHIFLKRFGAHRLISHNLKPRGGFTRREPKGVPFIHKSRNMSYSLYKQSKVYEFLSSIDQYACNPAAFLRENALFGGIFKMNATGPISSYSEGINLSCISSIYPVSLTQNELINFPYLIKDKVIEEINKVNEKYKFDKLTVVEMIDHTLFITDHVCIIINKTYGTDLKLEPTKQSECISSVITGFCSLEILNDNPQYITDICMLIEKEIKDFNLESNNAYKHPKDISLSKDTIGYVKVGSNGTASIDRISVNPNDYNKLDLDYYPYLDVDKLTSEFVKSDDKLLMLHGKPGVGKSKLTTILTHKLVRNYESNAIMFNGKLANNEDAWECLLEAIDENSKSDKRTLVLIDDLEPAFMCRSDYNEEKGINHFFTNLLTILDGLLSTQVKVIITTNYILKRDLDEPLYRPGRLFDSLHMRKLTYEEALAIVKKNKLSKSKISEFQKFKQEEISQAFVAQFVNETLVKIDRSYYKGDNKKQTKVKTSRIGF